MTRRLWTTRGLWAAALLGALVLPGLASAGYGPGSQLEADAPILLDGRVDALLPSGTASFVSSNPSTALAFLLRAGEANVTFRTVAASCSQSGPVPIPCSPSEAAGDVSVTLTDARVQTTRALTAYKTLVTTDRAYADTPSFGPTGELLVTTGASTLLTSNPDAVQTSAFEEDWSSYEAKAPAEPVYGVDALGGQLAATGGLLRATGGFEAFLQGVEVKVTGTHPDGTAYSETFATPFPREGEPYRYLVVEVSEGALSATSAAPATGFAPPDQRPIVDVRGRANFHAANGRVVSDEGDETHEGADVALPGPLSLTLTKVAEGETLRLGVSIHDGLALADAAPPLDGEPDETTQLLAAGAAGAGGAGLVAAALYFWPRLKFGLTALFLPLYSRIERTSVLEHEKRDEIYELIRATPGIHAHEIGEKAQIGWGTTVYHLKLLESHSLVVSKKSGRYKRFFVNTGEYTKKKDVYGALRNETAKAVADYIVNHPGTSQKDLCAALGIQPSLASWHVEKLEGVELVKRVKDGRQVRYFAGPAWTDLNVRLQPGGGADTPAET